MAKKAKSVKRGACVLVVSAKRSGDTFYSEKTFPVSWRGRNAAAALAKRRGYSHAVLGMRCPTGTITFASCKSGKCDVLTGSTPRGERKSRGKTAFNRPIAGARKRGR